jgi:molybdopterin-guanine dinucleotide biosynthesis protein B
MKIFALSGSDPKIRERLLESLVAELARRGVKVSVVVRMPEGFDMDKPGKDSFEHRRAGAREVVLASSERWALMAERPADPHGCLETLAARLSCAELLIADGFEENGHSRLLVLDQAAEVPAEPGPDVVAYALSSPPARAIGRPAFQLDDGAGIASFILAHCGLAAEE